MLVCVGLKYPNPLSTPGSAPTNHDPCVADESSPAGTYDTYVSPLDHAGRPLYNPVCTKSNALGPTSGDFDVGER